MLTKLIGGGDKIESNGSSAEHIYSPVGDVEGKELLFGNYPTDDSAHHSHYTKTDKESSIAACYFALANTIMGAGTLGLPFAVSNTGYVLGSVLLCVSGLASSFALHCLSLCALKLPYPSSFYRVASTALPHSEKLIDLAVILKCFGVATSYLIVIGGLMPDAMKDIYGSSEGNAKSVFESRLLWVSVGFVMVTPLSFFQQLGALRYTSFFSILFLLFLALLVVLFAAKVSGMDPCQDTDDNEVCTGSRVNAQLTLESMRVFSIFIFGFTCHQNMFTIVNELQAVSIARCNRVILYAIGTALTVYLVIANCGYYTYGDQVESNILQSYPKLPVVSLARIFVSLLVCFTYPLQCNPARRCVMTLLADVLRDKDKEPEELQHAVMVRYTAVTTVFLGLSFVIALSVEDLGLMLSLVGATGSTLVSYILPGFCYYFLFRNEGPVWKRRLALLQGCVGVCLVPICLTFIFVSACVSCLYA
ncbi:hypothetical protein EON64_16515 [archaeon]|nr:MAG: hypothetical protein EON64_16515 [archaeon]